MIPLHFSLHPFPNSEAVPDITITGNIERTEQHQISITYDVAGNIESLKLADTNDIPMRRWELWESSCFEFFVGIPGQANYWEVNLAPNGNWNVFKLDNYRQGICEAESIEQLKIITNKAASQLSLSANLALSELIQPDCPIEIAITAVIENQSGDITYWAVQHSAAEPDFHHRDSFTIKL